MGSSAKQCILGVFQDSDFAGDLEDSKSTSRGILCFLVKVEPFVPISWMCKKQTAVSHSSTESAVISLDVGLGMDGIPALDSWDLVFEVLHSSLLSSKGTGETRCVAFTVCEKGPGIRTKMKPPTLREMLFERV